MRLVTQQLLAELRTALAALVTPAGGEKPPVAESLQRIERLAGQLGDIDPRLRHYLTQRSYQKALMFLDGRETENDKGNCAAP